ncbi:MAG: hypothetical protein NVS9B10_02100 [Nevskia sp.]
MRRLFGWTGVLLAGWLGWWLGAFWNDIAAFMLSTVASGFGLYWGRRLYDEHIDWR